MSPHPNRRVARESCPRCYLGNTKFAYFNNKSRNQPRYLCKFCRRIWTHGGILRYFPFRTPTQRNRRPMGVSLVSARDIPSTSEQPPIAFAPPTFSEIPVPPVAPFPMGSSLASAGDIPSRSQQPPIAFAPTTFSGLPVPPVALFPMGSSLASARDIPSRSQQPPIAFAPTTFSGLPVPPVAPFPIGTSLASSRGIPPLAPAMFSGPPQLPFTAFPGYGNNIVFTGENNYAGLLFPWLARSGKQPPVAPMTVLRPRQLPVPAVPMVSSLASARGIPPLSYPTAPVAPNPDNGNYNMVLRGANYNAGALFRSPLARSEQQPYAFSNFMQFSNNLPYFQPNNAQDQLFWGMNYQSQVEIEIEIGGPSSAAGGGLNLGVEPDAPPPPAPDPSFGDDFNNENNVWWSDYLADGGKDEP